MTRKHPNVIFVLTDDLGWGELGCYGNQFNETPHLDRLAAEGVRFHAAYASSTVCSPSRARLLTGQTPPRNGITEMLGFPVPPEHVLDGESILPLLRGQSAPALQERCLFWHYPLAAPHFLGGESSAASRAGMWKLIAFFQRRELELYNLAADESERANVATVNPGQVEKQHALFEAWLKEVGGTFPEGQALLAPPLVCVKQSGATQ